jgi:hypothetical protein
MIGREELNSMNGHNEGVLGIELKNKIPLKARAVTVTCSTSSYGSRDVCSIK